jgi:hypothetical protein
MKADDPITQEWDGTYPHPATFTFPAGAILFSNTFGFYVNAADGTYKGHRDEDPERR